MSNVVENSTVPVPVPVPDIGSLFEHAYSDGWDCAHGFYTLPASKSPVSKLFDSDDVNFGVMAYRCITYYMSDETFKVGNMKHMAMYMGAYDFLRFCHGKFDRTILNTNDQAARLKEHERLNSYIKKEYKDLSVLSDFAYQAWRMCGLDTVLDEWCFPLFSKEEQGDKREQE